MNLISRSASEADIAIIKEIIDSDQLSLDPKEKTIGESEIRELLRGFFEPAITRLTRSESSEVWQSFLALNPDVNRSRFYLDIYTKPGASTRPETLLLAIELARAANPDFRLWLGVNALDDAFKTLLESRGFSILRKYHTLEMDLVEIEHLDLGAKVEIIQIDPEKEPDLRICWELHQDSFSDHFGFLPREFNQWAELYRRDLPEFKNQAWILKSDGIPAGFIDCDESLAHLNSAYVHTLGVSKVFRGKGFGEALLRHAIQTYFNLGRSKLSLNVDTGNESGALRLYEKVGMKPISGWNQYENLNWSKI